MADAGQWPWSSAKAHLQGRDDCLVKSARLLARIGDWRALLDSAVREEELRDLREHGRTGRPLGSTPFLDRLESRDGRVLRPQKGGRPRKLRNYQNRYCVPGTPPGTPPELPGTPGNSAGKILHFGAPS